MEKNSHSFKGKFFYCFFYLSIVASNNLLNAQISGLQKTVTDIGVSNNGTNVMVLQPDNKTISCGFVQEGGQGKIAFYRLDSLGKIDSTFGKNGIRTFYNFLPATYQGASIYSMAMQKDGKIVAVGTAWYQSGSAFLSNILIMRLKRNGDLDSTFGENGTVRTNIFSANGLSIDDAYKVLISPQGEIIVAGSSYDYVQHRMLFIRYLSNGQLDASFNNSGVVLIDINHRDDRIFDMVLQHNGNIIGAGEYYNVNSSWDVALVKLSANGKRDSSFGNNGVVLTTIGLGGDMAKNISLQSNGKIIIAGTTKSTQQSKDNILAIRYKKDGRIDSSFAVNGIYQKDISGDNDIANSLQIQTDDKMIIGGYTSKNSIDEFITIKLNENGIPDTGYGKKGVVTFQSFNQGDRGNAIVLQNNGKIIQAGQSINGASKLFSNIRFNSSGLLDITYGNAGGKIFSVSSSDDKAGKIVKLPWNNTLLVCGSANDYWALANYKLNLKLNTSFGVNGVQNYNYSDQQSGGTPEIAIDSALQKIYLCGQTDNDGFTIIRLNKNGSIDNSFGNNGVVNYFLSIYYGGLVVTPDHKIIIGGVIQSGSTGYSMIARFNNNGSIDSAFGINGQIQHLPMTPNSIINDSKHNRIIVGGRFFINFSSSAIGVMAIKKNGDLDSSFGTNGVGIKTVTGGGNPEVYFKYRIAQDAFGRLLVCGGVSGSGYDFSVTRFLNNGQPDNTFGNGGSVVTNTGYGAYYDSYNEGITTSCTSKQNCSIITTGIKMNDQKEHSKFVIVAYDNNGNIDSLNNAQGFIDTSFLGDEYEAGYATLVVNDKIYYAGKAGKKDKNDFLVLSADLIDSQPNAIQSVKVDYALSVSPNPAHDFLQVSYKINEPAVIKFQLTSIDGNTTYNLLQQMVSAGKQTVKISLPANISKGVYQLKLITVKGTNAKIVLIN